MLSATNALGEGGVAGQLTCGDMAASLCEHGLERTLGRLPGRAARRDSPDLPLIVAKAGARLDLAVGRHDVGELSEGADRSPGPTYARSPPAAPRPGLQRALLGESLVNVADEEPERAFHMDGTRPLASDAPVVQGLHRRW